MEQGVVRKHSKVGIISFSIAALQIIFWIFYWFTLSYVPNGKAGWVASWHFDNWMIESISYIGPVLQIVAFVLGVGGLLLKDRKKVFAIFGILLSAVDFILLVWWIISML